MAPPDDVSASFTFDTSDGATGTEVERYDNGHRQRVRWTYTELTATAAFATNIITAYDSATEVTVQVAFQDALDVNPDPLSSSGLGFTGEFPPTSYDFISGDATVAASATPLPPALPLFAAGLGTIGMFGWRRKRKNAATIASA